MIINVNFEGETYEVNLSNPLEISLPLKSGQDNPNCYYAEPVVFETIRSGDFVGSVKEGGSVNYQKISFTPHGNGTHTECIGHITDSGETVNKSLTEFHFFAELITVKPEVLENGDEIITLNQVSEIRKYKTEAFIIRTLPNDVSKKEKKYSGTNPPYFEAALLKWLAENGVNHFLTDLPSVDRESDEGRLAAHKAFWGINNGKKRNKASITELVFVENNIQDGLYFVNISIPPIEIDAVPSRVVLYNLLKM